MNTARRREELYRHWDAARTRVESARHALYEAEDRAGAGPLRQREAYLASLWRGSQDLTPIWRAREARWIASAERRALVEAVAEAEAEADAAYDEWAAS